MKKKHDFVGNSMGNSRHRQTMLIAAILYNVQSVMPVDYEII